MQKIAIVLCNNMHMDIERANELIALVSQNQHYQLITDYTKADVIIIVTSAYGEQNMAATMNIVVDIQNNTSKETQIIVTGCLVDIHKEELEDLFPDFEVKTFNTIKNMLNESSYANFFVEKAIPQNTVIISTGCLKKCAYCPCSKMDIPYTSKPMDVILKEVDKLCQSETTIYITGGLETSDYGRDIGCNFATLMEKICIQYPECDFVIGWFHPAGLTSEVVDLIAEHKNIKGIMIHIQHVSNRILKEAKRPLFEITDTKIRFLREKRNDLSISTQVITGLPGETDEEFRNLIQYLDTRIFDDIGVSSYEEVAGTLSSQYTNQVPFELRIKRMNQIVSRYRATPYSGEKLKSLSQYYEEARQTLAQLPQMILLSELARRKYYYIAGTDTEFKVSNSISDLISNIFAKIVNSRDVLEIERTHKWLSETFTKEFRNAIYEMFSVTFSSKENLLKKAKKLLE